MADNENKDSASSAAEKDKGGKGPMKLLLGVVLLIAGGAGIAVMALPKKERGPESFSGPWSFAFFDKEFVANTRDDNFSRYIKFSPSASFFAYDQNYPTGRKSDPDFTPSVDEVMTNVVANFTLVEIMKDGSGAELALAAQLEDAVEPVLFPVHVGETTLPLEVDPKSGLRIGESHARRGTFRGAFREYKVTVDAKAKTIKFADGDESKFVGSESDFEVRTGDGRKLFLDLTRLKPDFRGEVNVGVHGRIRQIHLGRKLAQ